MKTVEIGDIYQYNYLSGGYEPSYYLFLKQISFPQDHKPVHKDEQYWQVINLETGIIDRIYWWANGPHYIKVA